MVGDSNEDEEGTGRGKGDRERNNHLCLSSVGHEASAASLLHATLIVEPERWKITFSDWGAAWYAVISTFLHTVTCDKDTHMSKWQHWQEVL